MCIFVCMINLVFVYVRFLIRWGVFWGPLGGGFAPLGGVFAPLGGVFAPLGGVLVYGFIFNNVCASFALRRLLINSLINN